ncbi:HAMP domain-containing sensor histidine kinase [Lentzea sp. NPDC003310]|uniref:sensor histidine kinase n=1 Tax=Lentzea sp. NPDC003310 TaxID=3154447 RepID=UPI0033A0A3E9
MQRRLVVASLTLVVIALSVFTVPVGISLAELLRANLLEVVLREARTIAFLQADGGSEPALRALRGEFEVQSSGKVELVDAQRRPALGRAVDDLDAPALLAALCGQESVEWQETSSLDAPALVVTVPARTADGRVVGAVRLSHPTDDLRNQIRTIWTFRLVAGVVTLALTAVLAVLMARSLTRPLRSLQLAATRFGQGDLTVRAQEIGPEETRKVARAINLGAHRIDGLVTAQRAFVADVSHQLRSPLTALRLSLDNVRDDVDEPGTAQSLDLAIAEVIRLSRLVNDLLVLARAQADTTSREAVPVDQVVATRVRAWQAVAVDRGVALAYDVHPSAAGVRASLTPGHLDQVLDNLVMNALDATPGGAAVTVAVTRDRQDLVVSVVDQGPGLDEEQRIRAFDRFWRGKSDGTGLGLAIVRQLVEDNGGTAVLLPVPGGGLEARLRLPVSDLAVVGASEV